MTIKSDQDPFVRNQRSVQATYHPGQRGDGRGSPTDENYFSGSTFVPDFLLVGKLISEKGRPLRQKDLEKNTGVVPD